MSRPSSVHFIFSPPHHDLVIVCSVLKYEEMCFRNDDVGLSEISIYPEYYLQFLPVSVHWLVWSFSLKVKHQSELKNQA